MSAVTIDLVQDGVRRPVPPVLVLAGQEGRRMVRHPVAVLGLLWGVVAAVLIADNGPRDAFEAVTSAVTFLYGVPVFFAANLVASRDRRAHSRELLDATPVTERTRVVGLLVACLVPAAVAVTVVVAAHVAQLVLGNYDGGAVPGAAHLLTGPTTVLGGALLGVMVARWFPVPGAAALVMVAMVAWNVYTTNRPDDVSPLGTYVSWARWDETPAWVGFEPGSASWHIAYLLGLCAMAAAGALLPGAPSRWRVLLVGGAASAATAVFGALQLT